MKHVVIGTAGHIDHGKTRLTKALTGVDTDRLAEEKARGITIELGFAPLKLPDGSRASIVDVPGHEKFVKTMMAGASGIDLVLLVIAADEGVMPQTREHLDVLELLWVQRGILVVTKRDLVDETALAAVEEDVRRAVAESFLRDAPLLAVSAETGEGIPELLTLIGEQAAQIRERSADKPFRLPVDRTFSLEGFGTILAGTLTEGTLRVGESVTLWPRGETAAVRTLQTHNRSEEEARAGTRTAMSLTGFRGSVERGDVVAEADSLLLGEWLDVDLTVTPDSPYTLKNASKLHLFHGTRETVCQLRLLERERLRPGERCFAQLKPSEPLAVRNGDPFILRFFSPVLTVAGGTILDGAAKRHRRNQQEVLSRLAILAGEDRGKALLQRVMDAGLTLVDADKLRRVCNESPEDFSRLLAPLMEEGAVLAPVEGRLLAASCVADCLREVERTLGAYHEKYPMQPGMRDAELKSRCFPQGSPAEELLQLFEGEGRLKRENAFVSLPDFTPVFTEQHKIMQRKLLHYYRDAWFLAPDRKAVDEKFASRGPIYPQVLANMFLNGMLVSLTPRYAVHHEAYAAAQELFRSLFATKEQVTLADFRTAAGISRKYAQLFLEHWDREGLCRRVGEGRVLLKK